MRRSRRFIALVVLPMQLAWAAEGEAPEAPPPADAPTAPPPVESLPYVPEPTDRHLLELKAALAVARSSPSIASSVTLMAIGGGLLTLAVALWAVGVSQRPYSCGGAGGTFACVAAGGFTIAGLIFSPLGIVRLVRAINGRSNIPMLEDEIRKAGGRMTEE
jgi:hypothetical protein